MTIILPIVGLGCVLNRPVRGRVPRPAIGKPYADFSFVDDRGAVRFLGDQLADFTVVVLTRCDKDTHGPIADLLEAVVAEHREEDSVRVAGVDVHWSEGGHAHGDRCHLVDEHRDLLSICDSTGAVRRLYGAEDEDRLFVIGPKRNIILASAASKTASLRRQLREDVARLANRRANAAPP